MEQSPTISLCWTVLRETKLHCVKQRNLGLFVIAAELTDTVGRKAETGV